MGLKDLKGKLGGAFEEVKDKIPKKDQDKEKDNSPDWAVELVDKIRNSPDFKLDAAKLAEAAKNVPNDGSEAGKAKSLKAASEIINKEIKKQIKEHPEAADKLKEQQKLVGGSEPSVVDRVIDLGDKTKILKGKFPFPGKKH